MGVNPRDWIYDLESYPNLFTASLKHALTQERRFFEISEWNCDYNELLFFLHALRANRCRMVGYNNVGYDYPLIHYIIYRYNPSFSHHEEIFKESNRIIKTPWVDRFSNNIAEKKRAVAQLDLLKIHHFDNVARSTSLKMLEFNMRSATIQDLPYEPGTVLTYSESRQVCEYNDNDVDETHKFYLHSLDAIEFRDNLGERYLNYSDVKIGKEYIIDELEKSAPGICYSYDDGYRKPRQTWRASINLNNVIFPYIKFERFEFALIHEWLQQKTVTQTKGVFDNTVEIKHIYDQLDQHGVIGLPKKLPKSIFTVIDGFKFSFGLGGIHGSIEPTTIESNDDFILVDWDVASYYPNVAIKNQLYPEHLSKLFCKIYNETYQERKKHKKGTPENAALKLALNGGGFGGAGDEYCPIYDPQYLLSITVNGQLLLCVLAEQLLKIPKLTLVQINTDGVTVRCPRKHRTWMNDICKWWEDCTKLELESVVYKRMFIRDVNNYIGEYESGNLKRKGAYGYETPLDNINTGERTWHKNHSALIVPMAAEAALVNGQCIEDFIINHKNIYDFMLRTKVNRTDKLLFNDTTRLQRVSRYYISNNINAGVLTKESPPTKGCQIGQWCRRSKITTEYYNTVLNELINKHHEEVELDTTDMPWDERINTKNRSKYKTRVTNFEVGYRVTICNNIELANFNDIDYSYYIAETKKIVEPLR